MDIPIRLSPSGPIIATLAAGAMLRLAEARAAALTAVGVVADSPFGAALQPALPAPSATKKYRIEAECSLLHTGAATQQLITAVLEVSYDLGVSWVTAETVEYILNPDTQVHVHPRYILNTLPAFPTPAPASVRARMTLKKSAADAPVLVNGNTLKIGYASISEHIE